MAFDQRVKPYFTDLKAFFRWIKVKRNRASSKKKRSGSGSPKQASKTHKLPIPEIIDETKADLEENKNVEEKFNAQCQLQRWKLIEIDLLFLPIVRHELGMYRKSVYSADGM